jgi:hypothetical protein
MVLSAASRDKLELTDEDLSLANEMVTDLEREMPLVFRRIGQSDMSVQAEKLLSFVRRRKVVKYEEAYRFVHAHFPSAKDFEDVLAGLIRSGVIRAAVNGANTTLHAVRDLGEGPTSA